MMMNEVGGARAHDFLVIWSTHRAVIAKTQLSFLREVRSLGLLHLRKIASFHVFALGMMTETTMFCEVIKGGRMTRGTF